MQQIGSIETVKNFYNPKFDGVSDEKLFIKKINDILDDIGHDTAKMMSSKSGGYRGEVSERRKAIYSSWFWLNFSFSSTTSSYSRAPVDHGRRGSTRKKEDDDSAKFRILATVALGIITLVGAFFIGKAWTRRSEAAVNLADVQELSRYRDDAEKQMKEFTKNGFASVKTDNPLHGQLIEMDTIITEGQKIFQTAKNSAEIDLLLRIILVAGAAIGIAGAVFAVAPVLAGGIALTFVASVAIIGKWGMDFFSTTQGKIAARVHSAVSKLLGEKEKANFFKTAPQSNSPTQYRPYVQPQYSYTQPQYSYAQAQDNLTASAPGLYD